MLREHAEEEHAQYNADGEGGDGHHALDDASDQNLPGDGDTDLDEAEDDGQAPAHPKQMSRRSLRLPPGHIEVVDGRGRRRVQRAGQGRHGRREDGRNDDPDGPHREIAHDECREHLIVAGERLLGRKEIVEAGQPHADQQEEDELPADDEPAQAQGAAGLLQAAGAEVPLDHHLIGAVRGQRHEDTAEEARPERVGTGKIEREIEQAELVVLPGIFGQTLPPARKVAEQVRRLRRIGAEESDDHGRASRAPAM